MDQTQVDPGDLFVVPVALVPLPWPLHATPDFSYDRYSHFVALHGAEPVFVTGQGLKSRRFKKLLLFADTPAKGSESPQNVRWLHAAQRDSVAAIFSNSANISG